MDMDDSGSTRTTGETRIAAGPPLEDVDIQRIWRVMEALRAFSTSDLLATMLPVGTPARVIEEIAQHTRLMHGSCLVFPRQPGSLAGQLAEIGLTPGPPRPSTIVRARLARRYGIVEADLQVQIVHAALPGDDPGTPELELFVCPVRAGGQYRRLLREERRANYETHFALMPVQPEAMGRLWELLTGPAQMTPDGGGFNPYDGGLVGGRAGCTALYLRADGLIAPHGWPRRLELLLDGRHELLPDALR